MVAASSTSTASVLTVLLAAFSGSLADENFQDPPNEYRPRFRYWLPDASVPHEVVAKDISDIATAGAGGLEFLAFELYGLPHFYGEKPETPTDWSKYGFGTPAFVSLFKSALKATVDAGITLDFAMGANQAQGVPAEPGTPGLSFELRQGNVSITSGETFSGPVPEASKPNPDLVDGAVWRHPHERFGSSELVAAMAYKVINDEIVNRTNDREARSIELDQSSYVDLSPFTEDGHLEWTAPGCDDDWYILTFWERFTNQQSTVGGPNLDGFIGNGSWTVDHFNKLGAELMTDFWDTYILSDDEIASMVKSVVGHAWEDSLEPLATLYWTHGFLDRFEEYVSYSLVPYLPVLFRADNTWTQGFPQYFEEFSLSDRSLLAGGDDVVHLDYRNALNQGYQDFIHHFLNWTNSIGVKYRHQPGYNVPVEMFSDIPLIDTPEGESFGFGKSYESYRQFVGPAQLSGKKVISSELGAQPAPAYSQTIPDLLYDIKMSIAGGFSQHYLHGFAYSGNYPNTTWPGYTTFFYRFTDMWNSIQPCWKHMKDVLDYVARNQYIAQQGEAKVDLAFYSFQNPWKSGAPLVNQNLSDLGYTFSYFGGDNLLLSEAAVRNGVLFPDTISARALIFKENAESQVITVAAAEKLVDLAAAGLPIIFLGDFPSQTFPNTDESLANLAAVIEKLAASPNVHITSREDLTTTLQGLNIEPRVRLDCSSSSSSLYQTWRADEETGTSYVYFFNSNLEEGAECTASISIDDDFAPYALDAWTGSEEPLVRCSRSPSSVSVPLSLGPGSTTIISLRKLEGGSESRAHQETCRVSSVSENITAISSNGDGTFEVLLQGDAQLESSSGKTFEFTPTVPEATNLEAWNVEIEDWHAPEEDRFEVYTEITHHSFPDSPLVPWLELGEGMEAVSGIGYYRSEFDAPVLSAEETAAKGKLGAILKLGPVAHTVRVRLDGEMLPPVDIVKGSLDISDYVEEGKSYELEVEVSSLLFNRIKADREQTMIFGTVAGENQPQYESREPRREGLLGPVVVEWGVKREIGCKYR